MGGGLFVVGTDTEVGKTVVSAALVGLLGRRGRAVDYLKPVGSGAVSTPQGPASPDAVLVVEKTGLDRLPQDLCPVLAGPALAPAEALKLEGRRLDWEKLVDHCCQRLAGPEFMVVEGVGGLLVPLDERHLVADLVAALGLPVVVVARPGLGTINHSLLTLSQLDRQGAKTAGFLFSGPGQEAEARANAGWISLFSGAAYLGWLRPGPESDWQKFLDRAEADLNLDGLPGFRRGD